MPAANTSSPCPEQLRHIAISNCPSYQTAPCVQVAERHGPAWNPIDYVEHFTTTPAEVHDQYLDNLRGTESGLIVINRIKEFFKGGDGYLMTTQLPESCPLYPQMKKQLSDLRVEAQRVAQVCANAERWPPALAVTHSRVCFTSGSMPRRRQVQRLASRSTASFGRWTLGRMRCLSG